jgi:hypothetical protein
MLLVLMMQLEKLGFIAFNKNMMFFILLRNGNPWYENNKRREQSKIDIVSG